MKSKKVDTITNNEEQVRFEIFAGTLPIEEAGAEMLRLEQAQHAATRRRLTEANERLARLSVLEQKWRLAWIISESFRRKDRIAMTFEEFTIHSDFPPVGADDVGCAQHPKWPRRRWWRWR
jgi:hypothetical protein